MRECAYVSIRHVWRAKEVANDTPFSALWQRLLTRGLNKAKLSAIALMYVGFRRRWFLQTASYAARSAAFIPGLNCSR